MYSVLLALGANSCLGVSKAKLGKERDGYMIKGGSIGLRERDCDEKSDMMKWEDIIMKGEGWERYVTKGEGI